MKPEVGGMPVDELIASAKLSEAEGRLEAALERYEAALARARREGLARREAEVLRWMGTLHRERGELERARASYEESRAIAQRHGLLDQVASALNCLAAVQQFGGSADGAEALYRQARELAVRAGDGHLASLVDQNLGSLANIRGDLTGALTSYRRALTRAKHSGDLRAMLAAMNNMGMAYVDLGELDAAERWLDEAFEHARSASDSLALGYVQVNRAELYLKRQDYERARQACDDAFSVFTGLDAKVGLAEAYKLYGSLYREMGRPQLADVHLTLGLGLAESTGNRLLQAEVQHEIARLHTEGRRYREAIRFLNAAHALFRTLQAGRELLDIERQLELLDDSYIATLAGWGSEAIETKDPYTVGHSSRVAEYATRLGGVLGLSEHELAWLRAGALLHDVGKAVVPIDVLTKPGTLTEEEWVLMKRHPIVGEQIVSALELPYPVTPMVRSHHERWAGGGYPDGLAGEAIPRDARILSVADVFDALTSKRSYRGPFARSDAIGILQDEAGRLLDPEMTAVFVENVAPALAA